MITNRASLVAFIISLVCLGVYVFFLTPRQFNEVLRPKDWLTNLRWIILAILVISIITSIPSLAYQYYRMTGHDYEFLRNVSTILSQVSKLGTTMLLVLVYTYKQKQ